MLKRKKNRENKSKTYHKGVFQFIQRFCYVNFGDDRIFNNIILLLLLFIAIFIIMLFFLSYC